MDYDRELALVAVQSEGDGAEKIMALGRLVRQTRRDSAEFAVVVSDACQGQGLGLEMVGRLITVARAEGLKHLTGRVLAENSRMLQLCRDLGFELQRDSREAVVNVEFDLVGSG